MKKETRLSFGEELVEIGKNENIFVIDCDLAGSTKIDLFKKKYPDRFIEAGIAEGNAVGVAAGIAETGKIVFVSSFAEFITLRVADIVRQSVCYNNENVKLVGSHSGLSASKDGATHQALEDISLMSAIPNIKIYSPSTDILTKKVVKKMETENCPTYLRLSREKREEYYDDVKNVNTDINIFGDKKDFVIFTYGDMLEEAMETKKYLESKNIFGMVIDVVTLKPINEKKIIDILNNSGICIVLENHSKYGGLFSRISEIIVENGVNKKVKSFSMTTFGRSGSFEELLDKYKISSKYVIDYILEQLRAKK